MCRQEALLAAISEKDANIALLELSSSKKKKTQEEVAALKREKDSLVQQLKQQVTDTVQTQKHTHKPGHPSGLGGGGSEKARLGRKCKEIKRERAQVRWQ